MEPADVAFLLEVGRSTGSRLAEMEVEAHRDARNRKPVDQHSFDESGRLQSRERLIELHHDGAVELRRGEQAQLCGLVGQAKKRLVWLEKGARMRFEGQRRGRPPEGTCAVHRHSDHGAMAAVYALKIAHRDDSTAQYAVMGRRV